MKKCKYCGKLFEKSSGKGYVSFCSDSCQAMNWQKKNPDKVKQHRLNCWRNNKIKFRCLICGFDRTLDFCHIKPKRLGGKVNKQNILILCPNHHRLYDAKLLNKNESGIINQFTLKII